MAAKLECKVCGKLYDGCRSLNKGDAFRWQDVACCPEHGSMYFAMIMESRKPKEEANAEPVVEVANVEIQNEQPNEPADEKSLLAEDEDDVFDEDDFDYDFDDDFDEDEDEDDDWLDDDEDFGDDENI